MIVETVQNLDDLSKKKKFPFLSQSLSTFIVTVFEDIPLLALNLIFVICRDGTPSTASVIKATVCIGIVCVRFLIMLLFYWFIEAKKTRLNMVLDTISSVGLFLIAAMSVAIQLLKTFPPTQRGLLITTQLDKMSFVRDKYLNNVSIFAEWPLDSSNGSSYIWLADINEVIDHTEVELQIETTFNVTSRDDYTMCVRKRRMNCVGKCEHTACYEINGGVAKQSTSIVDLTNQARRGYEITLTKEPAQLYKYYVGYIDYNVQRYERTSSDEFFKCQKMKLDSIIYAKYSTNEDAKTFLRDNSAAGFSFYDLGADLTTVDKIWRTGLFKCPMVGDLGPKLNENMRPSFIKC